MLTTHPSNARDPCNNPNRLLTEKEAAEILNVSIKAMQHWRWAGGGPEFVKLGRLVRYEKTALLAHIEKNRKTNTINFN